MTTQKMRLNMVLSLGVLLFMKSTHRAQNFVNFCSANMSFLYGREWRPM